MGESPLQGLGGMWVIYLGLRSLARSGPGWYVAGLRPWRTSGENSRQFA